MSKRTNDLIPSSITSGLRQRLTACSHNEKLRPHLSSGTVDLELVRQALHRFHAMFRQNRYAPSPSFLNQRIQHGASQIRIREELPILLLVHVHADLAKELNRLGYRKNRKHPLDDEIG